MVQKSLEEGLTLWKVLIEVKAEKTKAKQEVIDDRLMESKL